MSFSGDTRHIPATVDPLVPLTNLSLLQSHMDSLHQLLSDSVNANSPLSQPQMHSISSEISSALLHVISNGAALLSCAATPKIEPSEVIEIDAVELLAEHVHFCSFCGKGFKRDANLRMHMRAHGNQFKTNEALANKSRNDVVSRKGAGGRFSCPHVGCNRNQRHHKFRPLKSVICVKNHFKRSHCPKMYSCDRCNKKSFSVVADLKSHLRNCGESKWRCSCGTSFSRKDKLFGHMALFEGHMPAVAAEEASGNVLFDEGGLFDGLGSIEDYCFRDVLDSPPNCVDNFGSGMDGFFDF